jgi:hypothetical protein
LGWESAAAEIEEIGLPLVGFTDALSQWISSDLAALGVGLVMLLLVAAFTFRALTSTHLVGWTFLGFSILALVFTQQVWINSYDITRALAPILTAYVLVLFAPAESKSHLTSDL